MCLLAIAFDCHHDARLIVTANRDEFYARPTMPMRWWQDAPILAGLDAQAGGTWLGLSRSGRFAAVTNYRYVPKGGHLETKPLSRGHLVSDFLCASHSAQHWAKSIHHAVADYGGFNLLLYDGSELIYMNNYHHQGVKKLDPGVYALSNHLLDSPWPKVDYARQQLRNSLANNHSMGRAQLPELLKNLSLQKTYAAHLLPHTGVSADWEHLLSSAFIVADGYGTRASSAVIISSSGRVDAAERSFAAGKTLTDVSFHFCVD